MSSDLLCYIPIKELADSWCAEGTSHTFCVPLPEDVLVESILVCAPVVKPAESDQQFRFAVTRVEGRRSTENDWYTLPSLSGQLDSPVSERTRLQVGGVASVLRVLVERVAVDRALRSTTTGPLLSLSVSGFRLTHAYTANSNSISLLNLSYSLMGCSPPRLLDAVEADYIGGMALLNARNMTQASELFLRASTSIRAYRTANPELSIETQRECLCKAVQFQLLATCVLNDPLAIFDKLSALRTALCLQQELAALPPTSGTKYSNTQQLFAGSALSAEVAATLPQLPAFPPLSTPIATLARSADITSSLLLLQPHLTSLLLLYSAAQFPTPVRVASLKTLDFTLEHLGCTVGKSIPHTLAAVLCFFPSSDTATDPSNEPPLPNGVPTSNSTAASDKANGKDNSSSSSSS
eukprot:CAMPEP_0175176746 /NCGR_PEP_ID=MMETSP0087-20121206/33981_1 /TAXON_ID=136419 /ORGANISM="Unknown Unknown, Strain D1" /LENGTH=408 /DNA_ID=CAMNT_0016468605 /DNA_START=6 /DNA_END=1229 /DNA_ORIENTATION=+